MTMTIEHAAHTAARAIVTFIVTMVVLIFAGGGLVVALGGNLGPTLLILFVLIAIGVTVMTVRGAP
jgi:hypothetical protein